MPYLVTDYKLASGWSNIAGLTAITALADANNINFLEPRGLQLSRRGQRRFNTDGTVSYAGRETVTWVSNMLVAQWLYITTTYQGKVTVRTALNNLTWANYNAVLWFDDPAELTPVIFAHGHSPDDWQGPGYEGVIWHFSIVGVAA